MNSFGCLKPVRYYDKIKGEFVSRPCGKCDACRIQRGNISTRLMQAEYQRNAYAHLITLTYADEFIPRLTPVYGNHPLNKDMVDLVVKPSRHFSLGSDTVVGSFDLAEYGYARFEKLLRKTRLNGDISFLSKTDYKRFLCSLRTYIHKNYNEKIRFFSCGEYGPKTFRAHFHFVLYHNNPKLAEDMAKVVSKIWKYGFTNTKRATTIGNVSYYLASYLNSFTKLPKFLQFPKNRPFTLHSRFFGRGYFEADREACYASPLSFFNSERFLVDGKFVKLGFAKNIVDIFFPRCYGYEVADSFTRFKLYTIFDRLKKYYPDKSCYAIAKDIYKYFFFERFDLYGLDSELHFIDRPWLDREMKYFGFDHDKFTDQEYLDSLFSRIYRIIYVSRHFVEFCCNSDRSLFWQRVRDIDKFYSDVALQKLSRFYTDIVQLRLEDKYTDDDVMFAFYDAFSEEFQQKRGFTFEELPNLRYRSSLFRSYMYNVQKKAYERIKHKIQNDANDYFIK